MARAPPPASCCCSTRGGTSARRHRCRAERNTMTTQGFAVSHAKDAHFERGLRSFFEYRDLGIKEATQGRVVAHVIRAARGTEFSSEPHQHHTTFQFVYILKGLGRVRVRGPRPRAARSRLERAPAARHPAPRDRPQRRPRAARDRDAGRLRNRDRRSRVAARGQRRAALKRPRDPLGGWGATDAARCSRGRSAAGAASSPARTRGRTAASADRSTPGR